MVIRRQATGYLDASGKPRPIHGAAGDRKWYGIDRMFGINRISSR